MALIQCNFMSKSLLKQTNVTVVLPSYTLSFEGATLVETDGYPEDARFPTLYLIHGWSDDNSCWTRFSNIERYAQQHGVAVVMPDIEHSYGVDMASGNRYGQYLCDELPSVMRSFFPLSREREDTSIAGLSMGGYAALWVALQRPLTFSAVVSLSGVSDIVAAVADPTDKTSNFPKVFKQPDRLAGTDFDIYHLLDGMVANGIPTPAFYVGCGTEDLLMAENTRFVDYLEKNGQDVVFRTRPGGHTWAFWDEIIRDVLDWLDEKRG